MATTSQGVQEYFHCPDCDITVHHNDKESHLSGGRHKYKIRQKTREARKSEPQFYCDICDTEFTDLHFYTIHQGSKTHKRNLRRINKKTTSSKKADGKGRTTSEQITDKSPTGFRPIPRRAPIPGINSYLTINDFKDISDYKGTREKYRPRNTKNPEGNNKTYICSVAAYWAVSLALEPAVNDFKISLNDKEWGDFGDAVVQLEINETKEHPSLSTTFAVMFKDVSNNVKNIETLAEGRFGYAKYVTQVNAIKPHKDVENKKFVVFTTATARPNIEKQFKLRSEILHKTKQECNCSGEEKDFTVGAKTMSNRRKLLINTSDDNDNIFFYYCTDSKHVLPKIYLYAHQKKQKRFADYTDDLVTRSLYGERRVEIHRDFTTFVEHWCDGYLGGNYKLKKEDVLVKLAHLLLYNFRIPPVVRTTDKRNYTIWQQAVKSVDVTVFKKQPVIISKVCDPINQKIETELGLKIDTTNSSVDLRQSTIEKIQDPVLKMYLFEETLGELQDDVPLQLVYDFFWKAGLVPLLIHVEDLKSQEHVLNIITLLKSLGLTRRYLLMTSDSNVKSSLRYYSKTLSFFFSVDDIADKLPSVLFNSLKINVSDQFSLSLKQIQESDMFFQKSINAHEFFDMSLGRYSFKPFGNNLARRDGRESQLVLRDETMLLLKEEIELKDEMKMVLLKYGVEEVEEKKQFLRGVRPNLFAR